MSQIEEELNTGEVQTSDQPIRMVGYIILFFTFGLLGTWSYFAPLDSAAIAPGVVTVKFNSKTVQHLEGGIVKRTTRTRRDEGRCWRCLNRNG